VIAKIVVSDKGVAQQREIVASGGFKERDNTVCAVMRMRIASSRRVSAA